MQIPFLAKVQYSSSPARLFSKGDHKEELIPGVSNTQYGSFGSLNDASTIKKSAAPWQAEDNFDVQRVTRTALIYELTQQQTRTIESVVPWFLENMPESYFRQVPERFRLDHIKAIAAVKDANMDLRLVAASARLNMIK